MTDNQAPPLSPFWQRWSEQAMRRAAPGWPAMLDELRILQDTVAATAPPEAVVTRVHELLVTARRLLEPHTVDDEGQIYGKLLGTLGRGQTLSPPLEIRSWSPTELDGSTTFGRFHSGSNDAVHGGAVALFFDEALGCLADLGGRPRSRTAALNVTFRSVTPVGRPLTVRVTLVEEDGRDRKSVV